MPIRTNHKSMNHRMFNNIGKKEGVINKAIKKAPVVEIVHTGIKAAPRIENEAMQMSEMSNFNALTEDVENQRKRGLESFIKKNKNVINSLQPKNKQKFLRIVQRKFFK